MGVNIFKRPLGVVEESPYQILQSQLQIITFKGLKVNFIKKKIKQQLNLM